MDVDAYLRRIGRERPPAPTVEALADLHRAHVLAVPFENLDIHIGREILVDETKFFRKVVEERRGGFCYELNGLFAWLLRALGYRVTVLSGRVFDANGVEGPEFDHLALRVDLDEPWLADVGFGDCFSAPIRLDERGPQARDGRDYRIRDDVGGFVLERRDEGGWSPQYAFSATPRTLPEFAEQCRRTQTSPDSIFVRKRVCTRATPTGRVTLTADRLIVTEGERREERPVAHAEYADVLRREFGVVLPAPLPPLRPA